MRLLQVCTTLALAAGFAAAQAPSITSVVNAASGIVQGLPNGGIAQGAIFLVIGSNMGPANLALDHSPFTSGSLLGTSVSVNVKGTIVRMLMYYTSAKQVAGLLPSNTPIGAGTVTVTNNSVTSAPAPITVVQNNLGIFTLSSDGSGAAIVTFPDYSLVSATPGANCGGPNTACGASNPGDVLSLWATGLGPVKSPDSSGPQAGDMPNVPVKVWLGAVQASVSYRGRSCCIGEDQVQFTVPDNAPMGCAVPLFVQINDQISNFTFMPVASGSRTCTPASPFLPGAAVQQLSSGAPVTYSQMKLNRRPNNNGIGSQDRGDAQFAAASVPAASRPFIASFIDSQPPGTCFVFNNLNGGINPPLTMLGGLDAGPSLTVNGPNGSRTLSKTVTPGQPTDYFAVLGPGNYLSPGTYSITGTGGADIGSFSASITIPQPPAWTNQASSGTVNRANGLTITWSGGTAQLLAVSGGSATDSNFTNGAAFQCLALASAGTLTVPSSVLLALPAGPNGFLTFEPIANTANFTASGLGLGVLSSTAQTLIAASFQ